MRDRLERYAQRLWRRWLRVARYAEETTVVDAMLRFRIAHHQEVRRALDDVRAGRVGLVRMLARARRTARRRMQARIEREVIRAALSVGAGQGREAIARVVRRAGYGVGASTVRRVLMRRGLWPGPEESVRDRGHPYETRSGRHGSTHCAGRGAVRRGNRR